MIESYCFEVWFLVGWVQGQAPHGLFVSEVSFAPVMLCWFEYGLRPAGFRVGGGVRGF